MSIKLSNDLNNLKVQISKDIRNSHNLLKILVETYSLDIQKKYMKVDFHYLLIHNIKEFCLLIVLQNGLKVIRKYATNLLKKIDERPYNWRSISFRNTIFDERVNPITGSIKILNSLGYTDAKADGLSYPISSQPNIPNVQMILVDLLGIDMELQYLIKRQHPYPFLFESYFKLPEMNNSISSKKSLDSINNSLEISSDKNLISNESLNSIALNELNSNDIDCNTKLNEWNCEHCTFNNILPEIMPSNILCCSMCFHNMTIPQKQIAHKDLYVIDNKKDVEKMKEIFSSCVNNLNVTDIKPVSPNYQLLCQLSNNLIPEKRRIRMLLAEGKMSSWENAKFALQIISQLEDDEIHQRKVVSIRDVIDLAENINPNTHGAVRLLQQECIICKETYPSRMIQNLSCTCKLCKNCVRTYYEEKIAYNSVQQLCCPQCLEPPINLSSRLDQRTLDHFYILLLVLKNIITENLYKILEEIIIHFSIQGTLIYCPWGCSYGFIADDFDGNYLICTNCKNPICKSCNKQWKDDHSCLNNQSDNSCPNCKMMFVLEKGGCLHIICVCNHHFCSFCREPYYNHEKKGLHCNHPRDCYFHLRDESLDSLEKLLKRHKISYELQVDHNVSKCILREIKDQGWEICNEKTVNPKNCLCEKHYKEHLIVLINKSAIDPVSIYPKEKLENMCKKAKIALPSSNLPNYDDLLERIVREEIPLKNKVYVPRFPTFSSMLRRIEGVYPPRSISPAIRIKNQLYVPDMDNKFISRGFIQQVS